MKKKKLFGLYISGILVGLITGILLWNILLARKIDDLYTRNRYLESSIENYMAKLEKLEKSQPEKVQTVKDIEVEINLEDELERIILQQAVKQKYEILLGRETDEVDLDLVVQVVDKRLFRTDKHQYQLHVDRVALSSTLKLWLSVREISQGTVVSTHNDAIGLCDGDMFFVPCSTLPK
jgi:cell division protein FtsB